MMAKKNEEGAMSLINQLQEKDTEMESLKAESDEKSKCLKLIIFFSLTI